ncbi:MAG: phage infection protein [Sporolactobacillus laevolacticus]|jgi:hypothetical protein|nr:phage infection protein [Sporolactobacillus laevolacticus]
MKTDTQLNEKYHVTYFRALSRVIKKAVKDRGTGDFTPDEKKKLAVYGVKYLIGFNQPKNPTEEEAQHNLNFVFMIDDFLSTFTPREFMGVFPIDKKFDGKRYEFKDYFYTMNYLKSLEMDKSIGRENLSEFLWEYMNRTMWLFSAVKMEFLADVQCARGEKDWFEQFAEDNNLTLYESFSDGSGEYMQNQKTGEIQKIIPHKRHLKWIRRVK